MLVCAPSFIATVEAWSLDPKPDFQADVTGQDFALAAFARRSAPDRFVSTMRTGSWNRRLVNGQTAEGMVYAIRCSPDLRIKQPMLGNLLYAAHRIRRSLMAAAVVLAVAASTVLIVHLVRLL